MSENESFASLITDETIRFTSLHGQALDRYRGTVALMDDLDTVTSVEQRIDTVNDEDFIALLGELVYSDPKPAASTNPYDKAITDIADKVDTAFGTVGEEGYHFQDARPGVLSLALPDTGEDAADRDFTLLQAHALPDGNVAYVKQHVAGTIPEAPLTVTPEDVRTLSDAVNRLHAANGVLEALSSAQ